jgi:hypothetical protein
MAATVMGGPITWRLDRDDDGFRTYRVAYLVQASRLDSPRIVMYASGLPMIGQGFQVSGFFGYDEWCWCRPEMSVRVEQEREGDPAQYYRVECVFSNKWDGNARSMRCGDTEVGDPTLEPMRVSGGYSSYPWEARYDRHGNRLVTSANEPVTGAAVTFDYKLPTVHVEQNVMDLGLSTWSGMVNTVNDRPLWGVPARFVKLVNASWQRKIYGRCSFFYVRQFDFEVNNFIKDKDGDLIGHDREIWDTGSMCLRGRWVTDASHADYGAFMLLANTQATTAQENDDPFDGVEKLSEVPMGDFMAYKDMNNEHTRVWLDGMGRPANATLVDRDYNPVTVPSGSTAGPPANWVVQYYPESNFLLLGIPTTL